MRREPTLPAWGLKDLKASYVIKEQIGEGVYGKVHRAREDSTGETVALKRVKNDLTSEKEGFPITALREIQILLDLKHECIVPLREVAISDQERSVYLVFDYLEHDLNGLVESTSCGLTEAHICCYMRQLVEGVAYMHSRSFLHRDIKASNLLISNDGHLKIGDWGLARRWDPTPNVSYTNRVITLWYRPPELLLGAVRFDDGYGTAIDVWSIGCIIAELLHRKPILPGNTEMEQMKLIFDLLGSPTEAVWPGVERLPLWNTFGPREDDSDDEASDQPPAKPRVLRDRFSKFERHSLDLIDDILVYCPKKRMSAQTALEHPYFRKAKQPHELERHNVASAHEWEVRKRRNSRRGNADKSRERPNGDAFAP
ncbi:kinase-like domain-containing protein [Pelagophyceae sp. CCMP2097]|nr:kinase-like domain-containing protein [Pelagophyceae sp. CCMP2097]|mmetsp:Transcript_30868/g.103962  ORF Transcript_30868/g.103962 Transcript_30868/m.103962 type:complete len:370 (-) Transcript_30868:69-1178(-)